MINKFFIVAIEFSSQLTRTNEEYRLPSRPIRDLQRAKPRNNIA